MSTRIQVILEEDEKAQLQRQSRREGMSLSAWIRAAALERMNERQHRNAIDSAAALHEFFDACDAREHGTEPEWREHAAVIDRSIASGAGAG